MNNVFVDVSGSVPPAIIDTIISACCQVHRPFNIMSFDTDIQGHAVIDNLVSYNKTKTCVTGVFNTEGGGGGTDISKLLLRHHAGDRSVIISDGYFGLERIDEFNPEEWRFIFIASTPLKRNVTELRKKGFSIYEFLGEFFYMDLATEIHEAWKKDSWGQNTWKDNKPSPKLKAKSNIYERIDAQIAKDKTGLSPDEKREKIKKLAKENHAIYAKIGFNKELIKALETLADEEESLKTNLTGYGWEFKK